MDTFTSDKFLILFLSIILSTDVIHSYTAKLVFDNKCSRIVLNDSSSKINFHSSPDKSWEEFSLVKDRGPNVSSGETTFDSVGYDLVHNNSDAIVSLKDFCDTVTTLLVDNSEAIVDLDSRVDVLELLAEDNSEAIVNLSDCCETVTNLAADNSEAIVNLSSGLDSIDHGPGDIYYSSNTIMSYNIYLGPEHKMHIQDDMVLNGSTYYIHFSRANEYLLLMDSGKSLTLQNIVLKDFSPDYVSDWSNIEFGDGVTIELCKDETLSNVWTFTSQGRIKGFGNTIALSSGGRIETSSDNNLILEDLIISGVAYEAENLRCRFSDSSITLKNSLLVLENDYTFSFGSFIFEDEVTIMGPTKSFVYSSESTSTINSESTLFVDIDTTFSYDPTVANRDLLVMSGTTSRLYLNGCTLYSTATGMRLKNGTALFDNFVTVSADGQGVSEAISFGDENASLDEDGVRTEVLSGARVEVYGYVYIR